MRRRDFLTLAAASAGAAMLPAGRAWGRPWGEPTDAIGRELLLGEGTRAERVLDLFLYGGMGPFETFYVVPEYGAPDDPTFPNQQWHLFSGNHNTIFSRCDLGDAEWLQPWATDALGMMVNLGPLVMPLRDRPDILDRMRVLVMRHDLEPHEAAIPIALSGHRLGSTRLCGIGANVQRYHLERDGTGRRIPWSYVLYPDTEIDTDNLRAASAVGLHPGSARPLDLRITSSSDLPNRLARAGVGDRRDRYDALVAHYTAQARRRYTLGGEALRSKALDDHAFAVESLANAEGLRAVLTDEVLAVQDGRACGQNSAIDTTKMGIDLATHLLTHPSAPARHVTVVDGGLIPASGGGGYDTHDDHLNTTARNLVSLLRSLVAVVNEPGEGDPTKLDLDDTMIVLNTEFGRTPYEQDYSYGGTNHHPYGYVTVLIGGPIGPEQSGILGAIGPDGWADRYLTPIEARAAVLAAMGIWPFSQEAFAIGDLRDLALELDGLAWLNEIVLGRRS